MICTCLCQQTKALKVNLHGEWEVQASNATLKKACPASHLVGGNLHSMVGAAKVLLGIQI